MTLQHGHRQIPEWCRNNSTTKTPTATPHIWTTGWTWILSQRHSAERSSSKGVSSGLASSGSDGALVAPYVVTGCCEDSCVPCSRGRSTAVDAADAPGDPMIVLAPSCGLSGTGKRNWLLGDPIVSVVCDGGDEQLCYLFVAYCRIVAVLPSKGEIFVASS